MGLLQTFARQTGSGRAKPGPTRGDLVLTEDALPAELAGWTRTKFIPAPPVDELPEGQYWWVHQWQYQKDGATALVSFDQLGEDQWHELTYCYRILDWTIHSRTEYEDNDGGAYIVAELRKDPNEVALLVFAVFFEDGTWSSPPVVDLTSLNQWKQATGAIEKAIFRFATAPIPGPLFVSPTSGHTRALQCQVLVSNHRSDTWADKEAAVELHLQSRRHFRAQWLDSRQL